MQLDIQLDHFYLVLARFVPVDNAGEDKDAPGLVRGEHGGVLQHRQEVAVGLVANQVLQRGDHIIRDIIYCAFQSTPFPLPQKKDFRYSFFPTRVLRAFCPVFDAIFSFYPSIKYTPS